MWLPFHAQPEALYSIATSFLIHSQGFFLNSNFYAFADFHDYVNVAESLATCAITPLIILL